jgi:hypothetical protein
LWKRFVAIATISAFSFLLSASLSPQEAVIHTLERYDVELVGVVRESRYRESYWYGRPRTARIEKDWTRTRRHYA